MCIKRWALTFCTTFLFYFYCAFIFAPLSSSILRVYGQGKYVTSDCSTRTGHWDIKIKNKKHLIVHISFIAYWKLCGRSRSHQLFNRMFHTQSLGRSWVFEPMPCFYFFSPGIQHIFHFGWKVCQFKHTFGNLALWTQLCWKKKYASICLSIAYHRCSGEKPSSQIITEPHGDIEQSFALENWHIHRKYKNSALNIFIYASQQNFKQLKFCYLPEKHLQRWGGTSEILKITKRAQLHTVYLRTVWVKM